MTLYKLNKKLYLDLATWRCGGNSAVTVRMPPLGIGIGIGNTALLNKEGFRCCLGQFSQQAGVPDVCLFNVGSPEDLAQDGDHVFVSGLTCSRDVESTEELNSATNTDFATDAMDINDDPSSTVAEKVMQLRALCKKYGYQLVVRNRQLLKKGAVDEGREATDSSVQIT